MPLFELSGSEAVATRKSNKFAVWGNRKQANRVEPATKPGFDVPFQIEPGEKIFTVGSCFARHVENALMKRGFELPMRELFKDSAFSKLDAGVVNNFGTPSIYNEFAWSMGVEDYEPDQHILEVQNEKYVDMHLISSIRPAEREVVLHRREAITAAYQSFTACKVVIITLGLVEIWFDSVTGYYLNSAPRPFMLKNEPDRFKLHVLSFNEALSYLEKAIGIMRKFGRDDQQIVLTVSPVPLAVTHRPQDVILANSYSKSVLRAVADTVTSKYDFVTYYPSFESVTLSDRQLAWKDDLQHVTDEIVSLNINRMVDAYVPSHGSLEDHKRTIDEGGILVAVELASTVQKGSREEASAFFEEFGHLSESSDEFATAHAEYLMQIEDYDGVVDLCSQRQTVLPDSLVFLKSRALLNLGRGAEAYEEVNKLALTGAKSAAVWTLVLDAAKSMCDRDLVLDVLNRWTSVVPQRAGRANALVGRWFHQLGEFETAINFYEIGESLNIEDALIKIYHVESLLAISELDRAKKVFGTIRPQLRNEEVLYDRLKDKISHSVDI